MHSSLGIVFQSNVEVAGLIVDCFLGWQTICCCGLAANHIQNSLQLKDRTFLQQL